MIERNTMESNVVTHCNNSCVSCSHASPFSKAYYMEPATLLNDLKVLQPFVRPKSFYLLGGEPLLHPKIDELIEVTWESGISKEVCILTNARLLDKMSDHFFKRVSSIRISVYPNLPREMITFAKEKSKQYGFGLAIDGISVFWKQFAIHPEGETFHGCPWKGACWTVHEGHLYLCPQAAFWPEKYLGLPCNIDGLNLHDGLTEQKILDYANRKEPLKACHICESYTVQVPWEECHDKSKWLKKSTV